MTEVIIEEELISFLVGTSVIGESDIITQSGNTAIIENQNVIDEISYGRILRKMMMILLNGNECSLSRKEIETLDLSDMIRLLFKEVSHEFDFLLEKQQLDVQTAIDYISFVYSKALSEGLVKEQMGQYEQEEQKGEITQGGQRKGRGLFGMLVEGMKLHWGLSEEQVH